jgi:FixJ family two-component response regulator
MPGLDGLELQRALSERGHRLPVVFLTGQGDIPKSVRAMKDGAVDFLTKPVDDEVLIAAVRRALEKDRAGRRARGELADARARLATLTPRERDVLEGVVAGHLNKQIAGSLGIAEKTVKVHRGRVMEKMGAASLADLVRLADHLGIRGTPLEDR